MSEPEPEADHMCVFVCDLQEARGCLVRSAPIAYGKKEVNGWRVLPSSDEYTLCAHCWNHFFANKS